MKKVFEALERLAMPDDLHENECKKLGISLTVDYETVKQAITELKAIKEAKPNKAIMCFKRLSNDYNLYDEFEREYFETTEESKVIWFALLKTQELEKIWEVLKEHLIFEYRGTETYANQTKYIVRIESKDTGATIHIHLDTQQELELIEEMSK